MICRQSWGGKAEVVCICDVEDGAARKQKNVQKLEETEEANVMLSRASEKRPVSQEERSSNSFLLYLNDTNKLGLALLQADHKVSLSCPPSISDNFSAS